MRWSCERTTVFFYQPIRGSLASRTLRVDHGKPVNRCTTIKKYHINKDRKTRDMRMKDRRKVHGTMIMHPRACVMANTILTRHGVMGGPDGPGTNHCLTGPPETFLEKINKNLLKCFIFSMQQPLLISMLDPICAKGELSSWITVIGVIIS